MIELTSYQIILLFILGGLVGVAAPLVLGRFIRPDRPNEEKNTTYESGEDPIGNSWGKFNIRFYVIALIFILFETELVFLFPWAIVFGDQNLIEATNGIWGKFAFVEMTIFILILVLGLAYVWAKGFLEWDKPELKIKKFNSNIPDDLYAQINSKYS